MPGYRLDRSAAHLLHRAEQRAEEIFRYYSAMRGLTARQLAVLMTVAENEGLDQMEATRRTGIDRSTMTDLVRRLVHKGLLQRRRSRSDLRAYILKLTDEGRQVLRAADPIASSIDALVLDALPLGQREAFLDSLQAIVSRLEAPTGTVARRPVPPSPQPGARASPRDRADGSGA